MLLESDRGFCLWCKQGTAFRKVHEVHYATPRYGGTHTYNVKYEGSTRTGVMIYECMHCDQSLVLLETAVRFPSKELDEDDEVRMWRSMVSPHEAPRELHESTPNEVRGLYAEASTCERANALRAAGVMYRAAVEELVKSQGAAEWGLKAKIKNLKGKLSDELIEDLHQARMLGDDSIHKGITYSAEEVEDVAKLIEEAVFELYVQPEQKRSMRDARNARRTGHGGMRS